MKFSLRRKIYYPPLFVILAIAVWVSWPCYSPERDPRLLITALTAAGSFVYFLYQRHEKETEVFRSLFKEFNCRYDEMNNALREIKLSAGTSDLRSDQLAKLDDYFNLCAEEYLYFDAGFIEPMVWKAWHNGIRVYLRNDRIRAHWKKESTTESYYGFDPDKDYVLNKRTWLGWFGTN